MLFDIRPCCRHTLQLGSHQAAEAAQISRPCIQTQHGPKRLTSNWAWCSKSSRMVRSPRAPVPLCTAVAAIVRRAPPVMCSSASDMASCVRNCLTNALLGSVSTRLSSSSVSACAGSQGLPDAWCLSKFLYMPASGSVLGGFQADQTAQECLNLVQVASSLNAAVKRCRPLAQAMRRASPEPG